MILAALAISAALDASPAAPTRVAPAITTERTPNLFREPAGCKDSQYNVVDRFGRPVTRKLGDLPTGALILAVERTIGGCQVVTVAHGWVARDQPNPPPQAYRAEPLAPPPVKREDAPSNRR